MSQAQASNEHDESGVDGREPVGVWVLEHASDARFPFRLRIFTRDRAEPMLSFFVQDRWPGSNQHIFCLRESRMAEDVVVDGELERVPVVALRRYGRRLSVVLARPRQKRCDFQIVDKAYKHPELGGPTTYEQIFWFTQTAMQQRRPRGVRLHTAPTLSEARVRIASDERYPWALGGFATERGLLPAGDYALVDSDRILAVVERKTFDGLLVDFGRMDILRQRLLELTAFEQHAVVIEARYEDFLSPDKSTTGQPRSVPGPLPIDRALRIYTIRNGVGIEIAVPAPRAEGLLTGLARPVRSVGQEQSPVSDNGA